MTSALIVCCSRTSAFLLCALGVLIGLIPALIKKTADAAEDAEGCFAGNTPIPHYQTVSFSEFRRHT